MAEASSWLSSHRPTVEMAPTQQTSFLGKFPVGWEVANMSSTLCGCFPILQAPKQKKQLLESKHLLQKSLENYVKLNIIEK